MSRAQRIEELRSIIAGEEISIENGAEPQYDDNDRIVEDIATCGTCGKSWNDALITERTPAPSARCPYEYIHPEIAELRKLGRSDLVQDPRPVTPVIFRVQQGEVTALFPFDPATRDAWLCTCYVHNGGHGAADPAIISSTRPATAEEYAPLKRELESYPYNYRLRVLRRFPRNAYQVRQAALPRA